MAGSIFTVLNEYGLLKDKNRTRQLLNMKPVEFSELLDQVQGTLPKWASLSTQKNNNPFNLWLPYPNELTLGQLTNYSLLFEKVYLIDPIYDFCSWMEMNDDESSDYFAVANSLLGLSENPTARYLDEWIGKNDYKVTHAIRRITASRLSRTIESYVQNRELIEEGVVVPFIEPPLRYEPNSAMSFAVKVVIDSIDKNTEIAKHAREKIKGATKEKSIDILVDSDEYAFFLHEWGEITRFLMTTSAFKTTFPSENSPNLELGGKNNLLYINKIIEMGASLVGDNARLLSNIQWPTPEDELEVTAIKGIPSHKIMEIRDKEQDAIEKFRYNTRVKLEEMRVSVKENDYSQLVKKFQAAQKEQIAEIKLLAEHIKKDHLRKIAHQISLMAFSAGGAILSASMATQNPASLIGIGVAGAGLSKGISSLIETWISYQEKVDALKSKDNYILWRVQSK